MLRTEELLAAHRFDGAEQYFTRAVDFGFSFSVEETLEKWGHQEILGDYVRMIRTIRPDVIVGFVFDGEGGGQHHQTSSRLTLEAFRAAADPATFPEQIEGRPAAVAGEEVLLHGRLRFGRRRGRRAGRVGACRDRARRRSFDVHRRRRSRSGARPHLQRDRRRSAQHAQVPGHVAAAAAAGADRGGGLRLGGPRALSPARHRARRRRGPPRERDLRRRRHALAQPAGVRRRERAGGARPPGSTRIAAAVAERARPLAAGGEAAAVAPLAARAEGACASCARRSASMGLPESGALRDRLPAGAEGTAVRAGADARRRRAARRGRRDGLVVAGQPVQVDLLAANRGEAPVDARRDADAASRAPAATARPAPLAPGASRNCRIDADRAGRRAADRRAFPATRTDAARYVFDPDVPFGLPFRPTPFHRDVHHRRSTARRSRSRCPMQSRSEGDIFSGEKRAEMHVVPEVRGDGHAGDR